MRVVSKIRSMGTGLLIGGIGLVVGVAVSGPGPTPGLFHAVMAAADGGTASGSTTTTTPHHDGSPTSTSTTTPHHDGHGTTSGSTTTTTPHHDGYATTSTTQPTTSTTMPATTHGSTDTSTSTTTPGSTETSTCDGTITSFTVTSTYGGRALVLTVTVSGHIGWMSAYAPGFNGGSLQAVPGGFKGTLTGKEPVAPGTKVLVGSCGGRVRASFTIGGDGATSPSTGSTTSTGSTGSGSSTGSTSTSTTEAGGTSTSLPATCSTATITSVTAVLGPDGHGVRVIVLVSANVQWMSGYVDGVGGIALQPITGGFAGVLTSSTPIPSGTEVVVGSCGGKLRAHATVTAAS